MAEGKGATTCCGCMQKYSAAVDGFCCGSECPGCKVLKCREAKYCKCTRCNCGCQKEDYRDKSCNQSGCESCKEKCTDVTKGEDCKCYLCSCGCNGVNCQCCRWCNPYSKCTGTCDRDDKHSNECEGKAEGGACGRKVDMGQYNCKDHPDRSQCDFRRCNPIYFGIGKCRFKCTNCGKLCSQDQCMIRMRIIIVVAIILAFLLILWALFPKKVRAIMIKIRAAFSSSPSHTGRYLSNLVGDNSRGDQH